MSVMNLWPCKTAERVVDRETGTNKCLREPQMATDIALLKDVEMSKMVLHNCPFEWGATNVGCVWVHVGVWVCVALSLCGCVAVWVCGCV